MTIDLIKHPSAETSVMVLLDKPDNASERLLAREAAHLKYNVGYSTRAGDRL